VRYRRSSETAANVIALFSVALFGACRPSEPPPTAEGAIPLPDGVQLHYTALGHGLDTVLVLHGGPGFSSSYLLDGLTPLTSGRTLIFYDQRGRGHSTPVGDTLELSVNRDIEDLEAVRRHFALNTVTLIGHHWGAAVAALYAARHPGRVDRMLLIAPYLPHPTFFFELALRPKDSTAVAELSAAEGSGLQARDPRRFCERFWGWYLSPVQVTDPRVVTTLGRAVCDQPDTVLRAISVINRSLARSLGYYDWQPALGELRVPVLVLQGAGPVVLDEAARRWTHMLPQARYLLLPPPALFPWLGDRSRFDASAEAFLAGGWPAGAGREDSILAVGPDTARFQY
jgi:pimeloyl-ACP methyl ester carboxylesterase